MTNLKDRIVLVTGASAGIGQACVRRFAAEGAKVIMAARRADRLKQLSAELGERTYEMELDVRNREEVENAVEGLSEGWKDIDILVNNAGLSRGLDKLHEGSPGDWEEMIDTNIKGLLWVSRAVIPSMVTRGRGHIVNIGSIAGHQVYPRGNVYCATKHAVDAITQGMRLDLVDTPVRVSTVDPGLVNTEFSRVRFRGDSQRANQVYQGYQPLTGEDIADTVVWVASRPERVQVAEVIILPSAQASAMVTHKESK